MRCRGNKRVSAPNRTAAKEAKQLELHFTQCYFLCCSVKYREFRSNRLFDFKEQKCWKVKVVKC